MSDWAGILWLVVLLLGNAFFVGAEFAVMSARRSQIEPLAEAGSKRAQTTLRAMENVSLMLACAQLGITVCSLLILQVAEPAIHHLMAVPLEAVGVPMEIADVVAFAVALMVVTFLHVTFGEMVPKNISVSVADKAALLLAPPLMFIARLVKPVIVALNWSANHILKLMRIEPKDEVTSSFTLEEVQSIVQESTRHGLVDDDAGLITGALEFSEHTASRRDGPAGQARDDEVGHHAGGVREGGEPDRVLPLPDAGRRRHALRLPPHQGRALHPGRGATTSRSPKATSGPWRTWPWTTKSRRPCPSCSGPARTWPA